MDTISAPGRRIRFYNTERLACLHINVGNEDNDGGGREGRYTVMVMVMVGRRRREAVSGAVGRRFDGSAGGRNRHILMLPSQL
jgi:hypothetical protein